NPWPHTFRKWCSQIPESLFNFTGIRNLTINHAGNTTPLAAPLQCHELYAHQLLMFRLHGKSEPSDSYALRLSEMHRPVCRISQIEQPYLNAL
ncbi:hypothetical protein, partial [Aeromonas caviae]|uniref:hypothetical protein n=1 Tax=Aeromonas caviae TaxID=648 RepID=UPI001C1FB48E